MKKILSFVALDLETTGLNPQTDTIIEIASVRFDIIFENNIFSIESPEERTMLVNPNKPLEEEVTLITSISNSMLENRAKWSEIKENVKNFIGTESIILGHNVLFDIEILENHGISLSHHQILDTFELSEIFSQEAKSLNLGFLADLYKIPKRGVEHRALTDTWISIDLFIYYLNYINTLEGIQKSLWEIYAVKHNSPFSFLQTFFTPQNNEKLAEWKQQFVTQDIIKNIGENISKKNKPFKIISLENTPKNEIQTIKNLLKEHRNIEIITPNKKNAIFLSETLNNSEISTILEYPYFHFCSGKSLFETIEKNEIYSRKYFIFLLKMIFWLSNTKTGFLDELKYYGEEYEFLEIFRLQKNEENLFLRTHRENCEKSKCNIIPYFSDIAPSKKYRVYKDIPLFEGIIRKQNAKNISFEKLISFIQNFKNSYNNKLIQSLRIVEAIYQGVPNRPIGENIIPPGKYGETYFFTQENLWLQGKKWLSIANVMMKKYFAIWKENQEIHTRSDRILFGKIYENIATLEKYHQFKNENIGVILTIHNNNTSIQLIERNILEYKYMWQNSTAYGFHLSVDGIDNFLKEEFGLTKTPLFPKAGESQITQFVPLPKIDFQKKTLILTTSIKHIREIGDQMKPFFDKIFLQSISGGKAKVKHYFSENPHEKNLLIGLIESWRDETELFENLNTIIIAKIPFDPPTDPYFLAKTNGMSQSFEKYSKPIVLSRLNSLIGNIISRNPKVQIICSDQRIYTTMWGDFMKKNLF